MTEQQYQQKFPRTDETASYAPERFKRDDLTYFTQWNYLNVIVPHDNIEGFND